FALGVHLLERNSAAVSGALSLILMLSLSHQPVTLALVYGDHEQFRRHRQLFWWGPLVAVTAVVAGLGISFLLVAVVAGLWNAEHTMMQRYGLTRMYGRMT